MRRPPHLAPRAGVALLGAALVVVGLWLSLISLIIGVVPQAPNPYVSDGDPCCSVPDTWAQVKQAAFAGWLWLGVAALPTVAGAALVAGAIRGRLLRWRWIPIGVAALMAVAGVSVGVAYGQLEEVPEMARCREARDEIARYRVQTRTERERTGRLIAECQVLNGRGVPAVINLLGPPVRTERATRGANERWYYGRRLIAVEIAHYDGQSWVTGVWVDRNGRPLRRSNR
jgi:hypothetical protein